jgi:hypothetical protein
LAFPQSEIYIRFGPTDHNLFSERVIGSEPPFQKSSKLVVATSETDFFRHRFLRGIPGIDFFIATTAALPCGDRESRHPLHHRSEQPPCQMTFRQQ